jgi:CUG-BP- and ETR3-like factor
VRKTFIYTMSTNAKLFVGQIPKSMSEEELTPMFQPFGNIVELSVIRDRATGQSKGCAFLTYTTREEADAAIASFHNQHTLPGMSSPIQVKYAQSTGGPGGVPGAGAGAAGAAPSGSHKLFIGMVPKTLTEADLLPMFQEFGEIQELAILRGPDQQSKGCAFLTYKEVLPAIKAIAALDKKIQLDGAPSQLVVQFASSGKDRNPPAPQISPFAGLFPGMLDAYGQLGNPYAAMLPGAMGAYGALGFGGTPAAGSPIGSNKEGPPGANLFIFHVPNDWTDASLYSMFSPYGNLVSCKIQTDKSTGLSRGFGFVSFDSPESAQLAIASTNGFQLQAGKRLKVEQKGTTTRRNPY